uniref:Uncharacterized protein n=1 Tax=Musa acuminata subsp. malaccensis TaxID=214687 RepID=A0A804I3G7_MUSAM
MRCPNWGRIRAQRWLSAGKSKAQLAGYCHAITSCTLTDMMRIQAAVTHFSQFTTP